MSLEDSFTLEKPSREIHLSQEDEDTRKELEAKLSEAMFRLDKNRTDYNSEDTAFNRYEIDILERLLSDDKVEFVSLSEEIKKQDELFYPAHFEVAFRVVESYLKGAEKIDKEKAA